MQFPLIVGAFVLLASNAATTSQVAPRPPIDFTGAITPVTSPPDAPAPQVASDPVALAIPAGGSCYSVVDKGDTYITIRCTNKATGDWCLRQAKDGSWWSCGVTGAFRGRTFEKAVESICGCK